MATLRDETLAEATAAAEREGAREIVAFRLAEQDFCIDIMEIREIRSWSQPAALPHAPPYVAGLVNLRGAILPVVDLSRRLGLPAAPPTERNVVVVARVDGKLFGLVVDGVSDILTVAEAEVQPTPAVGGDAAALGCVQGVIASGDRMIRLLDLRRVFPPPDGAAA